MELWIRSQDKERLIKPIDFYIEVTIDYVNNYNEFDIYALNLANDDISVGTYKTKERALEVLDEIQKKINLNNLGYNFGSPMIDLKNPTYIYEMPAK